MLALVEDGYSREIHYEFETACKANICLITAKLVFQVIGVNSFQKLLLLVLNFNSLLVVLRFNTLQISSTLASLGLPSNLAVI